VLDIAFDRQTSIVRVEIRTDWPELSHAMSIRLLELLNQFNLASRQTTSGALRDFLLQRLDTAHAELTAAEEREQAFLVRNRSYQNDPTLVFEHDRLRRDVTLRQEVYTTLVQAFEQARLTAVRNTPTVALVERPALPLRHDPRNVAAKGVAAGLVGVFIALVIALAWEAIVEESQNRPDAFAELRGRFRWLRNLRLRSNA
jgi:uncharacterized protein involved in exopolysaccharide biosynthesis